jgi:hypothetical protein
MTKPLTKFNDKDKLSKNNNLTGNRKATIFLPIPAYYNERCLFALKDWCSIPPKH